MSARLAWLAIVALALAACGGGTSSDPGASSTPTGSASADPVPAGSGDAPAPSNGAPLGSEQPPGPGGSDSPGAGGGGEGGDGEDGEGGDPDDPGPIGGPDDIGATITVDGMTWWFEVELGFPLDCIVSDGGRHIVAHGRVGGNLDGIAFAAELGPEGGWLEVDDPTTGQYWMARADREGSTIFHTIAEGNSQIDTIAVEGGRANGTATFIELRAYEEASLTNGTYPSPVFGTFRIRCPTP